MDEATKFMVALTVIIEGWAAGVTAAVAPTVTQQVAATAVELLIGAAVLAAGMRRPARSIE